MKEKFSEATPFSQVTIDSGDVSDTDTFLERTLALPKTIHLKLLDQHQSRIYKERKVLRINEILYGIKTKQIRVRENSIFTEKIMKRLKSIGYEDFRLTISLQQVSGNQ